MPTYEYACRECGHHLEVVQSFTDPPLSECPSCAGSLRKVFSPIGIAFKGSGFYKTDTRSSGSTKSGSGGGSSGGSESSDGGSKSSDGGTANSKDSTSKAGDSKGSTPSSGTGATKTA